MSSLAKTIVGGLSWTNVIVKGPKMDFFPLSYMVRHLMRGPLIDIATIICTKLLIRFTKLSETNSSQF